MTTWEEGPHRCARPAATQEPARAPSAREPAARWLPTSRRPRLCRGGGRSSPRPRKAASRAGRAGNREGSSPDRSRSRDVGPAVSRGGRHTGAGTAQDHTRAAEPAACGPRSEPAPSQRRGTPAPRARQRKGQERREMRGPFAARWPREPRRGTSAETDQGRQRQKPGARGARRAWFSPPPGQEFEHRNGLTGQKIMRDDES